MLKLEDEITPAVGGPTFDEELESMPAVGGPAFDEELELSDAEDERTVGDSVTDAELPS